jgi:hypothetical protein
MASVPDERNARMQPEGDEMAPQVDDDAQAATNLDSGTVSAPPPDVGAAAPAVGTASAPSSGGAPINGATYRPVGGSTAATLAGLWNESDRQRIRG